MLWTLAVILLVLWALGFLAFMTAAESSSAPAASQ